MNLINEVCQALQFDDYISDIDLRNNEIAQITPEFMKKLSVNYSLTRFDLRGNPCDSQGQIKDKIHKLLKRNAQVKVLNEQQNRKLKALNIKSNLNNAWDDDNVPTYKKLDVR